MPESKGQQSLEGLKADTAVSVVGTGFKTHETFELGQSVKLKMTGVVRMCGRELLGEEERDVVKIDIDIVEIV
jgi:hypothetical protein